MTRNVLSSIRIFIAFCVAVLLLAMAAVPLQAAGLAMPPLQGATPVAVAKYETVNIRSGPSTNYASVGSLLYGESCPVIGRDTATGWWLIRCPGGTIGWVSYDVVNVVGDTSTVPLYAVGGASIVAPPESQAPPQPATFSGWKASYFANRDLAGVPVLVQDVSAIDFDWGYGSPGPNLPADYFSARYERTYSLSPGNYMLTLRMDDGARVFVDDQLVMDDWRAGGMRELSSVRTLGGSSRFRVEYFEDSGMAALSFTVTPFDSAPPSQPAPIPPPIPPSVPDLPVPQDQWRGQYFNNTDLAGSAAAAQYEARTFYPLEENWGGASPAPGVVADYWSSRFEGRFYFTPADYDFFAQVDDGVRVWIDNILILDDRTDGYKERSNRFNQIGDGYHTMRVEYYERTGGSFVRVWWSYAGSSNPIPGPIPPPPF